MAIPDQNLGPTTDDYRALFDNSVVGIRICSVARGGRFTEANAAFQAMLGYSEEELLARTLFDVTHPDDVATNRALFEELIRGERDGFRLEKRYVRKDGGVFWGRLTVYARREDGEVTHTIGLVEDITDRKHAEAALLESSGRLQAVLDAAVDGIVLIDARGIIEQVNPAIERLFLYPPAELVGRNVSVLMPQPWRREHDGYIRHFLDTGEARIIGTGREVRGQRRDGSTFPLELAVSELRHGGRRFFLGTIRDVTQRKLLEEELFQAQKMEAIGRLAGGVAHDFNTLLGTIRGYSELLLARLPESDPGHRQVDQIHRAALRGAQLTRQLLTFSRRQEIQTSDIDLPELLEEMSGMLEPLIPEQVKMVRRVEPEVGSVQCDPGQLQQVVLNLVINACDAMPVGGRLTVSLRPVRVDRDLAVEGGRLPPGSYALLLVRDTGTGMDEPTRRRIFEPFFTTKEPGKGTGLGLSTVYSVVRQCRGGLVVESAPGQGTAFRVYLPSVPPASRSGGTAAAPAEAPSRGTVLLVEDDEMFRTLIQEVLAAEGYRVMTAGRPDEAVERVADLGVPVDLLVSDLLMPGGTGTELAATLSRRCPGLKVVLMSGHTDEVLADRNLDTSIADAFIQKPFPLRELLALVRKVVEGPPNQGSGQGAG